MRSLGCGERLVYSPQGEAGFGDGQVRMNFVLLDIQRFVSFFSASSHFRAQHEMCHQNAAPDDSQRIPFYGPAHLRRRLLEAPERTRKQAWIQ